MKSEISISREPPYIDVFVVIVPDQGVTWRACFWVDADRWMLPAGRYWDRLDNNEGFYSTNREPPPQIQTELKKRLPEVNAIFVAERLKG